MNRTFHDDAERALLRELAQTWALLNFRHFGGAMRAPTVELGAADVQAGRWLAGPRVIRLSRALVTGEAWGAVVEVLKHEMAHQYVTEVLGVRDESAHGPAFRHVCERLGLDATASGLVRDPGAPEPKVVRRIRRLLALATSPNAHEAQAAMNAAHRLMLKHNIDTVQAGQTAGYGFRQVGAPARRVPTHVKVLSGIVTRHFFVKGIWTTAYDPDKRVRGRVLELMGTPDNLDIALWVWHYVLDTADRLWLEHRRVHAIPGNRDRQRFLAGVMAGFDDKLRQQARACQEEGLIWMGDAGLETFFSRRYPQVSPGRSSSMTISDAWRDGRAAGRTIVLRRPVQEDAATRQHRLAARD